MHICIFKQISKQIFIVFVCNKSSKYFLQWNMYSYEVEILKTIIPYRKLYLTWYILRRSLHFWRLSRKITFSRLMVHLYFKSESLLDIFSMNSHLRVRFYSWNDIFFATEAHKHFVYIHVQIIFSGYTYIVQYFIK